MAKVIMIQGTMSGAGKSLLAAGLCRIFRQDGYRVAPFKSQNMALNSFITSDGLEMGRAQVMQAEAAGIEPSVLMNPVLLKPTSDVGSQVIVNGQVRDNMSAVDYFKYKQSLVPEILFAYRTLAREYDIIVVEGAGSPAEINLKSEDIVNMGFARMIGAPVLLAGDIDRGGVFAQLAGTMLLLEPEEKQMVKGLIINKFRGDQKILDPGIEMLKSYTPVPVVGVVPYMQIDVDDEDSLAPRLVQGSGGKAHALLDIAVIRLPRISNFTDFNPLERISGVSLRYVSDPAKLGSPDLIILPGTKSTMADLLWLRSSGFEALIRKAAAANVMVLGICGGFQMLGRHLSDPENAEGGGELDGMDLLPFTTVFSAGKTRTQVKGTINAGGLLAEIAGTPFAGYEIHMGHTVYDAGAETFSCLKSLNDSGPDLKTDGCCRGSCAGTYVHGLFDKKEMQEALIRLLMKKKGLDDVPMRFVDDRAFKETQYDLLADTLRKHLDMQAVYRILEEGLPGQGII